MSCIHCRRCRWQASRPPPPPLPSLTKCLQSGQDTATLSRTASRQSASHGLTTLSTLSQTKELRHHFLSAGQSAPLEQSVRRQHGHPKDQQAFTESLGPTHTPKTCSETDTLQRCAQRPTHIPKTCSETDTHSKDVFRDRPTLKRRVQRSTHTQKTCSEINTHSKDVFRDRHTQKRRVQRPTHLQMTCSETNTHSKNVFKDQHTLKRRVQRSTH